MAAGLGFKTFNTGDVLSAADVNGYLMQGILVFASATARDAAITSPEEGQFAFLKDTNVTTYYTGSAWANVDTTGMTNPMTTTGDVIYSSSGSTPARLGIGTAGQVLKVNAGATAPEWGSATASSFKGALAFKTTTAQSIADDTFTAITFNNETFDTDTFHSTSSNTSRMTIPAGLGGYYSCYGAVRYQSNAAVARRGAAVYKNGAQMDTSINFNLGGNVNISAITNVVVSLAAGDYVELFAFQDSGGSLDALAVGCYFGITYLGA